MKNNNEKNVYIFLIADLQYFQHRYIHAHIYRSLVQVIVPKLFCKILNNNQKTKREIDKGADL